MSYLVDEVARILASPMPRRQAFRLLGGVVAGSIAGALGVKRAQAQFAPVSFRPSCSRIQQCCAGSPNHCEPTGRTCCGQTSCPASLACCTTGSRPFCATVPNSKCCGNTACRPGYTCCTTASNGQPFCATGANANCCGNSACSSGQTCCKTAPNGRPFCATVPRGGFCCGNTFCRAGQSCLNGRCQASPA